MRDLKELRVFGFTLIELIIVVIIVGILAVVAMPKYFANVQKARRAAQLSNCRAIRDAMVGYYGLTGVNRGNVSAGNTIIANDPDGVPALSLTVPTGCSVTGDVITCAATRCTVTMNISSGNPNITAC